MHGDVERMQRDFKASATRFQSDSNAISRSDWKAKQYKVQSDFIEATGRQSDG
jgi:hypothetical protein